MIDGGEHENGTEGYDGMDFPMVAANVQYKDTEDLILDPYYVEEIVGQQEVAELKNEIVGEANLT
ncbi:hypothetical protein [Alkalibacillus aidingensis]|uniref:hypothetical protein n=1 Tax=Alkalibacillus aidingensis TaxID=2747607 RepID=UPI001661031F|nr:hypothetical protein [Alkalibacillus aidingensis]